MNPSNELPAVLLGSQASLIAFAQRCFQEQRAFMSVEVRELAGSAPRTQGTVMLVSLSGVGGSIGGGHLELKAISRCRELLSSNSASALNSARPILTSSPNLSPSLNPPTEYQTFALGPSLGQCCGGRVVLAYTLVTPETWPSICTTIKAMQKARFHLNLFGAGHVGRALVKVQAPLPCTVRWIDERANEFDLMALPLDALNIERCCVDSPEAEVARSMAGDYYLVTTHSHDLDLLLIEAILKRSDTGYVGLIGSVTKRARFESKLARRGIATRSLVCPVGLPGIAGKEPELIALAVAAQLLQLSATSQKGL